VFTDAGRCYWLRVYEIPQAGRATKGTPIVNLINVSPDTKVQAMVFVREFKEDEFLLFCTRNGTVKKKRLSE
jgi:DNA gyrase subunit A